jgi:hypothetical protein
MNDFNLKKYLTENKLTANSKKLNESKDLYKGVLDKTTFGEDEVYFVNIPELGNIPLQNKVESDLGEDSLQNLLGKSLNWKVVEFNHLEKRPEGRYRVVGLG